MAHIKVNGIQDPIYVSSDVASSISARKESTAQTLQSETWVQIGTWQGYLSQVKSIVLDTTTKSTYQEDYNRLLTQQELKDRAAMFAKATASMVAKGILPPTKKDGTLWVN